MKVEALQWVTKKCGAYPPAVVRAAGKNDGDFEPFADGLRRAWRQIIYFLVDANIDPRIVDEAKKLNTTKCRINTVAWTKVSKQTEDALQAIAADSNGGKYKFVWEKGSWQIKRALFLRISNGRA